MQRRTLLKLGLGSAVLLALAGGTVALLQPGLRGGKLSERARLLMGRVGETLLEGTVPTEAGPRQIAINGMLDRLDALVASTPAHVQKELSDLLGLLVTAAGRRGVVGLAASWEEASVADIATALQAMRVSSLSLRQQAYQGLHELVSGAYFAGTDAWAVLGYPGPLTI